MGGVSKRSRDPPWNCRDNDWKLGVAQGESRDVPALLCFPPLLVEMASHQDEESEKLGKKWPELTIPTHPPPGAPGWISLKAAGNRESLNLWQQVFPPLSTARRSRSAGQELLQKCLGRRTVGCGGETLNGLKGTLDLQGCADCL